MLLILVMKVSDFMEIANGARMNRIVELLYYTSAPHGMKSKVKVKDHFLKEVQAGAFIDGGEAGGPDDSSGFTGDGPRAG